MHDALTFNILQEQSGVVVYEVVWYLLYRNKFAVTTKHRPCRGRQGRRAVRACLHGYDLV